MILTCPTCYSQFKASLAVLGNQPRKVRCTACGEVWTEKEHLKMFGDKDVNKVEGITQSDDSFSEVLDSVDQPTIDDEILEIIKPDSGDYHVFKPQVSQKDLNTAYAIVASVFVLILVWLLMSAPSMMQKYPGTYAFYRMFGYSMDLPSDENVTFTHLSAENDKGLLTVSGNIVNRRGEEQSLKMMQIKITDGAEHVYASWFATPPKAVLQGEETVAFTSEYHMDEHEAMDGHDDSGHGEGHGDHGDQTTEDHHGESEGAHSPIGTGEKYVEVTFVMKPSLPVSKTDEADGEDTQALPEGENDHPSAHEAH